MPIALVCSGWMVLLTTPSAVVLLVCMYVGGYGCPISSSVWRAGMASHELMQRAPISASAAEGMTALITWAMVSTAPLLGVWMIIGHEQMPSCSASSIDFREERGVVVCG